MTFAIIETFFPVNELQAKGNFDNVKPLNGKPSAETEGLTLKKSDLAKSDDVDLHNHILSETPNLYKQNGVPMSKIPYFFETPVPKYFREAGWFENENTWKYVTWAFSKCQTQPHTVVIEGRELTLAPYEFISGRLTSPKECYLTENIFRNQQKMLVNAGFLKKSTNSKTNHYSCYVWVTERFNKSDNQQNNQPRTNHAPTVNHKSEVQNNRSKESHPSIPSFPEKLNDDLFSKEDHKNKIHVHEGRYPNGDLFKVYLSQQELDEILERRGSMQRIKDIIDQVAQWPGRKSKIKDWFSTINKWEFKNVVSNRTAENEKLGQKIHEIYGESTGWSARIYRDPVKDVRGILFESSSPAGNPIPIFIPFTDGEFKNKCNETIKSKNMKTKEKE